MPREKANLLVNIFFLYTIVAYVWVLFELFSKGIIETPIAVSAIYLTALSIYVGDKEIRRNLNKHTHPLRHGEYYVYLWGLTFFAASMFVVLWGSSIGYVLPADLSTNAGVVVILYFITDFLKTKRRVAKKKKRGVKGRRKTKSSNTS